MKEKLPEVIAILLYILIYLLRLEQGGWEPKFELLKNQRQALDQRIESLLPSPQAEILSGILLGHNKNLPGKIKLALRDTSTIHIVVASGQNLSMVAGLFLALSGLLRRKVAIFLGLASVFGYIFLTGFQVPILRAAIMFILASIAQIFGRQRDGIRILILTAGSMLLINPNWLTNLSFQLSFLSTAGVVIVAPVLLKFFKKLPVIGQDLSVTMGAQLLVLPVIAQNFHQLSLVSIFTNLLVGFTIPFIMIFGSLMIIFGPLFAFLTNILLTYFIYIVEFFSSLPFSWQYVSEKNFLVWVGYYMILTAVLLSLNNDKRSTPQRFKESS